MMLHCFMRVRWSMASLGRFGYESRSLRHIRVVRVSAMLSCAGRRGVHRRWTTSVSTIRRRRMRRRMTMAVGSNIRCMRMRVRMMRVRMYRHTRPILVRIRLLLLMVVVVLLLVLHGKLLLLLLMLHRILKLRLVRLQLLFAHVLFHLFLAHHRGSVHQRGQLHRQLVDGVRVAGLNRVRNATQSFGRSTADPRDAAHIVLIRVQPIAVGVHQHFRLGIARAVLATAGTGRRYSHSLVLLHHLITRSRCRRRFDDVVGNSLNRLRQ
mmetsp:Transcript_48896/g.81160  ORF Transcript_48896/g.81160 Transcript_48896/m.81160 type:complete len:266 (+) Transcript_48896:871-1668(+)